MATKIIEGKSAIMKLVTSIAGRGVKLQKDIHQAAMSALIHADKHGDVTVMGSLIEAMPGMARKNSLIAWAEFHGKFAWEPTTKTLGYDNSKKTLTVQADETPFYKFAPEPEYKPFDFAAELGKFMKRIEVARKHGDKLPEDSVAVISALASGRTVTIETPASAVPVTEPVTA